MHYIKEVLNSSTGHRRGNLAKPAQILNSQIPNGIIQFNSPCIMLKSTLIV